MHLIWALSLGWLFATSTFAAPPDLTASGVIAGIDRTNTYNLGATGLRGWIWVDRNNMGEVGLITDQCRQILVTHATVPASAVLAVDDVILGAMAASSGTVPDFTSDCRKSFATAISDAEKTGAGTLRVKRWRAGVVTDQNISLPILGNYSVTAPFSCPKSTLILDNVRNKMVADLLANSNYLTGGFSGSSNALALLSGVQPGDPNYDAVQTRLQTYARSLASAGPLNDGLPIWSWSYNLIFLSEYYLITSDSQVVPGIQSFTLKLAQSQSIYGTYGHGPSAFRLDGSGRRVSTGYGPVNAVGGTAAIALVMGRKALVAASQSIDPEIDAAIQRSSSFLAFFVNKGGIPYGEHEPSVTGHGSNGKDAMPAVFFGLQTGRAAETEYFSRISIAGWIGREYGHTGQGLSYFWTTLGALMGGPDAASEHLKQVRWHLDLSRRTDGSFAYDGQEQYGPGRTSDNTYLGTSEYGGMTANAMYLLTYSLPLQRLWITGKSANTAYTLNSTKIASAIAAGSFRLDRSTKSISELFTAIGDYDPIVRNYASIELASRSLPGTDLTSLRNLLSSADPNLRQSACQTLGIRQDSTALPTIVARLNDPDNWVRAKAATAIRAYPSATASTHRDAMMTSFIANATDPDVINWTDPIQMGNGKLSLALFGNGVPDGTPGNNIAAYTINASKQSLLYPALRAGLKQPDSYPRLGAAQFSRTRLPLVDTQALYPDVEHVAAFDTPADRMWSNDCRDQAITLLANQKIADGIPLALSMLEVPYDFAWGSGTSKVAALKGLAAYADAARYTIPSLRNYLTQWDSASTEYAQLVTTINTLENAITAPAQAPGLCVANSQVVTTTGAKAITLTGASPRGAFSYLNVTQPAHGTISGTAPNLTYTPTGGYTGPDQFTFQTTDTLTTSTVATVGIVVGSSGNGLQGEYFNNSDFTSPVLPRTDSQINFDWGTGSPHASIGADTFSVRWSGALLIPATGNYTFSALTSDGVRLYLNGNLVLDRFVDQSTRWTDSSSAYLTAGQYAEIYVEYYENTGSAVAKLKWTGPGFAGANGNFIPQAYLFDGSGMSNRPAYAFSQSLTTNQNTASPVALNGSGGTLTYTVLTQPTNGVLSGSAPNLSYIPNSNFSGTDSFTFLVNNGTKNSLPATISINVQSGTLSSFTWASAVSGNWSDATNWTPSLPAAAGQPTYALNFTSAGTYTATHNLNNGFQLNQLNTAANVTLAGTQSIAFVANGGSLPQFNQNRGDTVRIDHPMSLQSMTTLGGSGGGRVILNGAISGTGGLIKSNPGILQIGQLTNSYSGGTVLNAGTVELPSGNGSLTPALGSGTITFNQGAALFVDRTNLANNMIFNGGTVTGGNSFSSVFSGSITLNGIVTFDFGTTGGFGITGNISGPGGFTYTGPFNAWSELPCSGTNTYTGPTTVLSGTLSFPSVSSVPPGPLILSGDSKLKLNFTGTRVIESFTLDGVLMPPGTYGSATSPATTQDNTHFTGNGTITVLQPTTTSLNLTTGSSPANPGTSLTFTATVTGSSPTGNVQFHSGTTLLGTSSLNGSYQATFTTSQLAIGSNSITARYVGNAFNSPSSSSPVVVEINNTTPAAPTNLTATPAGTQINLAWTASPGTTGYYVKRSTTNGGPYTIIAFISTATYQDPDIVSNTTYYYVISAVNSLGESPDSNPVESRVSEYTVTFDANEGSAPSPLNKQVFSDGIYGAMATTSRSGYTFDGWFTAPSGGTRITAATKVTATTNHTLYAQWNALPVVNAGEDQTIYLTQAVPWGPAQLTPQLWLDADDTNTITLNGATVSQWADKSGFNRHATATGTTQPTATAAGLNGKRVITFDGNSDVLSVNLDFLASVSHSAFIVTKPTAFNNIYGAANGSAGANSLHVGFNGNNYRMNYWSNDYGPARTANFVAGSANIINYIWTSGISKQILANGKSEGTNASAGVIGTMSGGGRIGSVVGQGLFGGDIAEFIMVTGAVSAADREKIEGYLAHKWGLAGNLAIGHPHKSGVPGASSASANLDGAATDPDPLTYAWTVVSGPGAVVFGNATAIDTTASFSVEGVYTLRLTANDGVALAPDDIVVTVSALPTYTVGYNGNANTGGTTPSNQIKPHDVGLTLSGAGTLVRTGYAFSGWNTAGNGSGTSYAAGTTYTANASATLYAQWIQNGVLAVTSGDLASSGTSAGPFSPSSKEYTLQNTGGESIDWTMAKTASWVNLSATSGTLAAGATTRVTVSINANANSLVAGSYNDTITFANTTNGTGNTTRGVALTIISAYQGWANGFLSANVNDPLGNDDGDNLPNLLEFAFGTNPTSPVVTPLSYVPNGTTSPGTPILETAGTPQSPIARAVFARRKDHATAGITYQVRFSANLLHWKASNEPPVVLSGASSDPIEAVSMPFPASVPLSAAETEHAPPRFFRVVVSGN